MQSIKERGQAQERQGIRSREQVPKINVEFNLVRFFIEVGPFFLSNPNRAPIIGESPRIRYSHSVISQNLSNVYSNTSFRY